MTEPTQKTKDLLQAIVDYNDPIDLAAMYLELLCGKESVDPTIENTAEFEELWKDYDMEDNDEAS